MLKNTYEYAHKYILSLNNPLADLLPVNGHSFKIKYFDHILKQIQGEKFGKWL